MARVEVRQLRYTGEPAKAGRVEHVVADALRTEVVDDGRLVLVRSFRLGRIGLGQRGAAREVAGVWRTVRDNARHGGASGAESANCVWFTDAAEARMLLLRELASGRTPFAWFWMLAVPDWRRAPLAQWLDRRLDEAVRDASGEALAALVGEAVAADCVGPLAAAILGRVPPLRSGVLPEPAGDRPTGESERNEGLQDRVQPAEDAVAAGVALTIVRSVPAPLRAVLAGVVARVEQAAFVDRLARGLVRRAHPALALAPARGAAIAAAVARGLRFGETSIVARPPRPAPATPVAAVPSAGAAASDGRPPTADRPPPGAVDDAAVESEPPPAVPLRETSPALAELRPAELRSSAAGLFLAIVPLIRLGFREWLVARPHLLLHQPGPHLLRLIAAHYRVPASDPLWGQLPQIDIADGRPPDLEQALPEWRAGLDGWLRRKARLRLADLVLRPGWLLPGVETTLVRFPLETIEIRLRRLALDGDPGWVDWLGHSYRLVYRDRPLLGSDLA